MHAPLRVTLALAALCPALLAQNTTPVAHQHEVLELEQVAVTAINAIDRAAVDLEDLARADAGLPPRFAIPHEVLVDPFSHGTLEVLEDELLLWRLRVQAPQATSINLGFRRYVMPEGGQLLIYSADGTQVVRPFTSADNEAHGELWTPVVRADEIVVELSLPGDAFADLELELTHIGYGYRGFGTKDGAGESGSCNVDVVCPEGDDWANEIPSVGVISTGGSTFCTGFMVNNTANDRTPYFVTANHCGIGSGNAASLVVYWNYETTTCDGPLDGTLNQFNTGSSFRASYSPSDVTLVELDDDPNPDWGVTFSGWDRSGADESGAIAIHHPSTDEKRISFEFEPTTTTTYLGDDSPGNGTHVRVEDWDIGTTEGGSSGSPLYNPDHQVVGQLHGGFAACGNDLEDWYGKWSLSWTGGGTASSRLSDWLDPLGTGAVELDTLGVGLSVSPGGTVVHEGPIGGPFSNPTTTYTLKNASDGPVDYEVALTNVIGFLLDGGTSNLSGTLAVGATTTVDVTMDASFASLGGGLYSESIVFSDLTNGIASTRLHTLEIGRVTVHSWPLDTDPGWTTQGAWAYGQPTGGGGEFGLPDPTSGATGPNVYGYNLAGDYTNNMAQRHLTSEPFNCQGLSGVRVRFMRWLNVEQPLYDHAYLRASNDGTNWTTIWENGSEITESSWSQQEYDISAVADGQPSVQLRWTQGTTDGSWLFSGWNIDDVEVNGLVPATFTQYGVGLAGAGGITPTISAQGSTQIGSPFSVVVDDTLGGSVGILAVGGEETALPFFGGSLLVAGNVTLLVFPTGGASGVPGAGGFGVNVTLQDVAFTGLTFHVQGWVRDPSAVQGIALSDGIHLFIEY